MAFDVITEEVIKAVYCTLEQRSVREYNFIKHNAIHRELSNENTSKKQTRDNYDL